MIAYLCRDWICRQALLTVIVFCTVAVLLPVKVVHSESVTVIERSRLKDMWAGRGGESWANRHKLIIERVKKGDVDLIFIGDSIMHNWETDGKKIWKDYYSNRKVVNMGFGGDRIEHVLWRLGNGELEGIQPKVAVLMIGTNNSGSNSSGEIAAGIVRICEVLRFKLPDTKILLIGIFPRGEYPNDYKRKVNRDASTIAASRLSDDTMIYYLNIGKLFLDDKGKLSKKFMPDYLHPNSRSYKIWAEAMEPLLEKLLQ